MLSLCATRAEPILLSTPSCDDIVERITASVRRADAAFVKRMMARTDLTQLILAEHIHMLIAVVTPHAQLENLPHGEAPIIDLVHGLMCTSHASIYRFLCITNTLAALTCAEMHTIVVDLIRACSAWHFIVEAAFDLFAGDMYVSRKCCAKFPTLESLSPSRTTALLATVQYMTIVMSAETVRAYLDFTSGGTLFDRSHAWTNRADVIVQDVASVAKHCAKLCPLTDDAWSTAHAACAHRAFSSHPAVVQCIAEALIESTRVVRPAAAVAVAPTKTPWTWTRTDEENVIVARIAARIEHAHADQLSRQQEMREFGVTKQSHCGLLINAVHALSASMLFILTAEGMLGNLRVIAGMLPATLLRSASVVGFVQEKPHDEIKIKLSALERIIRYWVLDFAACHLLGEHLIYTLVTELRDLNDTALLRSIRTRLGKVHSTSLRVINTMCNFGSSVMVHDYIDFMTTPTGALFDRALMPGAVTGITGDDVMAYIIDCVHSVALLPNDRIRATLGYNPETAFLVHPSVIRCIDTAGRTVSHGGAKRSPAHARQTARQLSHAQQLLSQVHAFIARTRKEGVEEDAEEIAFHRENDPILCEGATTTEISSPERTRAVAARETPDQVRQRLQARASVIDDPLAAAVLERERESALAHAKHQRASAAEDERLALVERRRLESHAAARRSKADQRASAAADERLALVEKRRLEPHAAARRTNADERMQNNSTVIMFSDANADTTLDRFNVRNEPVEAVRVATAEPRAVEPIEQQQQQQQQQQHVDDEFTAALRTLAVSQPASATWTREKRRDAVRVVLASQRARADNDTASRATDSDATRVAHTVERVSDAPVARLTRAQKKRAKKSQRALVRQFELPTPTRLHLDEFHSEMNEREAELREAEKDAADDAAIDAAEHMVAVRAGRA